MAAPPAGEELPTYFTPDIRPPHPLLRVPAELLDSTLTPLTAADLHHNLDKVLEVLHAEHILDDDGLSTDAITFTYILKSHNERPAPKAVMKQIWENYVSFIEETCHHLPGRRARTQADEIIEADPKWSYLGEYGEAVLFKPQGVRMAKGYCDRRVLTHNIVDGLVAEEPQRNLYGDRIPYTLVQTKTQTPRPRTKANQPIPPLARQEPFHLSRTKRSTSMKVVHPYVHSRPIDPLRVALYLGYGLAPNVLDSERAMVVNVLDYLRGQIAAHYRWGAFSPWIAHSLWKHPIMYDLLPAHTEAALERLSEVYYESERWTPAQTSRIFGPYWPEPAEAWVIHETVTSRLAARRIWKQNVLINGCARRIPPDPDSIKRVEADIYTEISNKVFSHGGITFRIGKTRSTLAGYSEIEWQSESRLKGMPAGSESTIRAPPAINSNTSLTRASTVGASRMAMLTMGKEEPKVEWWNDPLVYLEGIDSSSPGYWFLTLHTIDDLFPRRADLAKFLTLYQNGDNLVRSLDKFTDRAASQIPTHCQKLMRYFRTFLQKNRVPFWPIEPVRLSLWLQDCRIRVAEGSATPLADVTVRDFIFALDDLRRRSLWLFQQEEFWRDGAKSLWCHRYIRKFVERPPNPPVMSTTSVSIEDIYLAEIESEDEETGIIVKTSLKRRYDLEGEDDIDYAASTLHDQMNASRSSQRGVHGITHCMDEDQDIVPQPGDLINHPPSKAQKRRRLLSRVEPSAKPLFLNSLLRRYSTGDAFTHDSQSGSPSDSPVSTPPRPIYRHSTTLLNGGGGRSVSFSYAASMSKIGRSTQKARRSKLAGWKSKAPTRQENPSPHSTPSTSSTNQNGSGSETGQLVAQDDEEDEDELSDGGKGPILFPDEMLPPPPPGNGALMGDPSYLQAEFESDDEAEFD